MSRQPEVEQTGKEQAKGLGGMEDKTGESGPTRAATGTPKAKLRLDSVGWAQTVECSMLSKVPRTGGVGKGEHGSWSPIFFS